MSGLRTYRDGVALVTGAASGIGKAVAEELARRGCEVVLTDVDTGMIEANASAIRAAGGRATAKRLDVTDAAAVAALVGETIAQAGRLDYIFNNAGIAVAGEAVDHTLEAWRRIVEVNLMGVVHGVLAAYPAMVKQGYGHIVNTASSAGLLTMPGGIGYSTTKHGVVGLSKTLRAEGAVYGVRASAVCPGVIRTPILTGGRHGVLLFKVPETEGRAYIGGLFERLGPVPADVFARILLDRVARNDAIIVIPRLWHFFWWLDRILPAFGRWLAVKAFEANRRRLAALGSPVPRE